MDKFVFKLFITGQTPKSQRASANLHQICERELGSRYELTIIDILEQPQLAEDERILATPTLIKLHPKPVRRLIGDLSNAEVVLHELELELSQSTEFRNLEVNKDDEV